MTQIVTYSRHVPRILFRRSRREGTEVVKIGNYEIGEGRKDKTAVRVQSVKHSRIVIDVTSRRS